MKKIEIPAIPELYDPNTNTFISTKACTIQIENSLVSISKWEAIWHKSFFSTEKTTEQVLSYIKCMTLTQNVPESVYLGLQYMPAIMKEISDYVDDPMTATTFWDDYLKKQQNKKEIITSELVYYWMIKLNIPIEAQKWHINRLLTLIRVFSEKDAPPKKWTVEERRALNKARKAALHTKG